MKSNIKTYAWILFCCFILIASPDFYGDELKTSHDDSYLTRGSKSSLSDIINLLNNLALNSRNEFFKLHCRSIIDVIEADKNISTSEESLLENFYSVLSDTNAAWSTAKISSYLERKRPFIISWTSQTDGAVSLAWLLPPKNWEPEKSYPLYVRLHGYYMPYQNPIEYMTIHLRRESVANYPFDDGYLLMPWGRGNLWYEGIAETDIWESINALEGIVKIDQSKKYLCGFSMGGYGVWYIGHRSPDKWAALGIFAAAISNQSPNLLTADVAQKLKNVPVYIICGDRDGLLADNCTVYNLLQQTGNQNLFFTTFPGGHEASFDNQQNMGEWLSQWANENVNSINMNELPPQFELYQNYPNPFNPSTVIGYKISTASRVNLKVYDVLGREVSTLVDKFEQPGNYYSQLSADKYRLSSGIYFYRLQSGRYMDTKKMFLIK